METEPMILWTGGVDSTVTLYRELQKNPPGTIRTVTFLPDQVRTRQQEAEAAARKRLTKYFNDLGYRWHHTEQRMEGLTVHVSPCPQPMLWVGLAACVAAQQNTVMFSWLRTDYQPSIIQNAVEAFNSLIKVGWPDEDVPRPTCSLPLIEMKKVRVYEEAHQAKFLKLCSWCEQPTEDLLPCGRCDCCISSRTAEYERKLLIKIAKTNKTETDQAIKDLRTAIADASD